jgi:3-oxoacyl-[acyl-carrier protein] reductase
MTTKTFTNQVAIVTGAGQGIGLEIALQLAAQGAAVVINDLEKSLSLEASDRINKNHGKSISMDGDVSDESFIGALVAQTVSHFGRLDLLVANAGITLFGGFLTYNREDFMKVMEVNLAGSFFLAQAAAQQMINQESGGSILFMSSVTGRQAHKDLAAYGMSKAALELLAKHLVLELSPYGITTNAIAPGATMTDRTQLDPDYVKRWSAITPVGKPASPTDIANAALFLLSPNSRHITGQTLVVDGGWTNTSPSPY